MSIVCHYNAHELCDMYNLVPTSSSKPCWHQSAGEIARLLSLDFSGSVEIGLLIRAMVIVDDCGRPEDEEVESRSFTAGVAPTPLFSEEARTTNLQFSPKGKSASAETTLFHVRANALNCGSRLLLNSRKHSLNGLGTASCRKACCFDTGCVEF